jgi:hypothetical protein
MVEKNQGAAEAEHAAPAASPAAAGTPRRPGHRGMDPRETVAELTARAHEISQQAGSKVAAAMKNVIGAAAGLTGFAVESARDLIQYMVRRGQMTQMEGDKLLREVEAAHGKRSGPPKADANSRTGTKAVEPPATRAAERAAPASKAAAEAPAPRPTEQAGPAKKAATKKAAAEAPARASGKAASDKPAAEKVEKSATRTAKAAKSAEKVPAAKAAPKKPSAKGAAKKSAAKGSASRTSGPERPKAAAKSAAVKKKR